MAVEAKFTSSSTTKYFTQKEITELQYFCDKFGAEPWVAIKFGKEPWYFFPIHDLKETNKNFAINLKECKNKRIIIEDVTK